MHTLIESFNYALEGIVHTLRTQRNMKIHFTIAVLVLLGSLFINISKQELIILFFSISFVIAMEMINTAIEVIIDMISEEYSYPARVAKNIAAGAVFMAAVNSIIVAYIIFRDELGPVTLNLIRYIIKEPSHLVFINIAILIILIIILKAIKGSGTPLLGGMPSGHSALSFTIATIIILLTENVLIAVLVVFLALLVVQSRLQTKTHNLLEVFVGSIIGILIALIMFQII